MPHNAIGGVGAPFGGAFAPTVGRRPIVGKPLPKRCCVPKNLNRIAECFQFLTEGTHTILLSHWGTTGVNMPFTDVDAAHGGAPRRLLEHSIVEKLMFAYQRQFLAYKWQPFTLISGLHAFWPKTCMLLSVLAFCTIPTCQHFTFVQRSSISLDSPQSHRLAPQDCLFQIQRMYSDAEFDGDYDFAIKHDLSAIFGGDMTVQSQTMGWKRRRLVILWY